MTEADAKEILLHAQFVAQRLRSMTSEEVTRLAAAGGDPHPAETAQAVLNDLNPYLNADNPLNLVDVTMRMLEGDRSLATNDFFNFLVLAHKEPLFTVYWDVMNDDGFERLPTAMEFLSEQRGVWDAA